MYAKAGDWAQGVRMGVGGRGFQMPGVRPWGNTRMAAGDHYGRGGFFDFIGKALGGIAHTVLPLIPGGSTALAIGEKILGSHPQTLPPPNIIGSLPTTNPGMGVVKRLRAKLPKITGPGGLAEFGEGGLGLPQSGRGYSMRTGGGGGFGGRRRHMNVQNPHALRRAIRRLEGAEKQYSKLLHITKPGKCHHGHVAPRARKGKR